MKKLRRTKINTTLLVLLLAISAMWVVIPFANAQEPAATKKTYAFVGATPNPVGVNQEVLLHVGITDYLYVVTDGWEGITLSVTKPDGETYTMGPYRSDSTGGTGAVLIPDQVGTYYLQTHFPEQTYLWPPGGRSAIPEGGVVKYLASESPVLELVVNNEPRAYYPETPLPEEYWTRPIDAQLREWYTISANWLIDSQYYAPNNDYAPDTPHVLWTKPITTGGLAGGATGQASFEDGDAYEGIFHRSVIINGVLYYNRYPVTFTGSIHPQEGIVAVDLRTGEQLWMRNNSRLDLGQTFFFDSFNYHGVFDYLWDTGGSWRGFGSTWKAYDPFDGEWLYTMENVPIGTPKFGPKGEIYILVVNTENNWMALWNSTATGQQGLNAADSGSWGRLVHGKTFDANNGYSWNVSIPSGLAGSALDWTLNEKVVGASVTQGGVKSWALDLQPGQQGDLLFSNNWQTNDWIEGNVTVVAGARSLEDGVFTVRAKEIRGYYGFSTDNGEYLWGPTEPREYLEVFLGGFSGESGIIAYGKLFLGTMGGVLYCHDAKSGRLEWTYEMTDPNMEILWSNYWPIEFAFATDGKVYLFHTEHSAINPRLRGAPFVALDVETGNEVFRVDGLVRTTIWGGDPVIGDSIIAVCNTYDNRIFAIGKGPSSTTVTAANKISKRGESVLLEGSVLDISAGTEDPDIVARYPNGVPAIADEDMGEWMKHVYNQFPLTIDLTGVQVKLEAIDSNGGYEFLGTATTDMYGNYGFTFKPEAEGQYMVIATFEGSNSYWGSTSTTYLAVDQAGTPGTPIEPEGASEFAISTEVAIIAAVAVAAVIGVAAYWFLKRK